MRKQAESIWALGSAHGHGARAWRLGSRLYDAGFHLEVLL